MEDSLTNMPDHLQKNSLLAQRLAQSEHPTRIWAEIKVAFDKLTEYIPDLDKISPPTWQNYYGQSFDKADIGLDDKSLFYKWLIDRVKEHVFPDFESLEPHIFLYGQKARQIEEFGNKEIRCFLYADVQPTHELLREYYKERNQRLSEERNEEQAKLRQLEEAEVLGFDITVLSDSKQVAQRKKHPPRATQKELVLLAQLLFKSRFTSEETKKEEISEAMHIISGHSSTTIFRDFKKEPDETTQNNVKNALKDMLKALEQNNAQ